MPHKIEFITKHEKEKISHHIRMNQMDRFLEVELDMNEIKEAIECLLKIRNFGKRQNFCSGECPYCGGHIENH